MKKVNLDRTKKSTLKKNIVKIMSFLGAMLFTTAVAYSKDFSTWFMVFGDMRGEIKPCGCSAEGDMGGLERRASYLEQKRAEHQQSLYFDLGNNFPKPSAQGTLKIELIQKSLKTLKPEVILLGGTEWQYGLDILDKTLPYLASNFLAENTQILRQKVIERGQKTFDVWGFLSPSQVYQNQNAKPLFADANPQLLEKWQESFKDGATRVLLFRGNEKELELFAKSKQFDVILLGNPSDDELDQELSLQTSEGTFLRVATKGQGALEGTFPNLKMVWLYSSFPNHPSQAAFFEKYDADVKTLFFQQLEIQSKLQKDTPYAGATTCQTCHVAETKIWQKSVHAHAFATLEKVDKQYDPECIQCHTVGFQKQGFLSDRLTPEFKNVQCENCHGASKAHATNPAVVKPALDAKQMCVSCHQGSHSPTFQFEPYWTKIRHSLFGQNDFNSVQPH